MKYRLLILGVIAIFMVGCEEEIPGPDEVFMNGYKFTPASITVSEGTTVTWTNKESVDHTVTSDTTGIFDSGTLSKRKSFSYLFTTTGTYNYHCSFHSNMKGTVIVE